MSTALAANSRAPEQPSPPSRAAAIVSQYTAQLRLIGAAGTLALKLAALGIPVILWFAMSEELYYLEAIRPDDSALLTALMFGSVFVARLLAPHARPVIVSAVAFCVSIAWLAAILIPSRMHYGGLNSRLETIPPGSLAALLLMLAAAGGGHVLFAGLSLLMRRLDSTPEVANLLPTFGQSPTHGDYRPQLDHALRCATGTFATLMRNLRIVLLGAIVAILILVSHEWAEESALRRYADRSWSFWTHVDVAIWTGSSFVISVIAAIALLPAGRRRSCIVIPAGVLICMALGTGIAVVTRGSALPLAISRAALVILAAAAVAVPACAAAQFIGEYILRRILPAALARHVVRPAAVQARAVAAHQTALCCEQCGYALDGLPIVRCERCGIDELRCPECGHQQPAGVQHARAITRAHKLHIAIRVASWLIALALALASMMPWFIVGRFASGRMFGSNVRSGEMLAVMLFAAATVVPLRLVLLHARPALLFSLLVGFAPLLSFAMGATFSGGISGTLWDVYRYLLPGWLLGSFAAPLFWRVWLMMMYGRSGAAVYAWHRAKAYRHPSPQIVSTDVDRVAGTQLPMRCLSCDGGLPQGQAKPCEACGVRSAACPQCATPRPISAVRVAFESMVSRARQMALMLTAAHFAAACAIGFIVVMVQGFQASDTVAYSWNSYSQVMIYACMVSLCFGGLLRISFVRRQTPVAVGLAAAIHLTAFLGIPLLASTGSQNQGTWLVNEVYWAMPLCALTSLVAGALLALPLLRLLATGLLPAPHARDLMDFLRAKITLDQATCS